MPGVPDGHRAQARFDPPGRPPSASATSGTEARAYSGPLDTVDAPRAGKTKTRAKGRMRLPDKRVTVNRVAQHHFVAVAILLATIGPQRASALPTMDEVLSAYQQHLYGRPVEVLRMHAEQSNAVAQFTLGQMYVEDTLEAFELHDRQWLLIASAKDDDLVSIRPFDAVTFSLGDLWAGGASVQRPA